MDAKILAPILVLQLVRGVDVDTLGEPVFIRMTHARAARRSQICGRLGSARRRGPSSQNTAPKRWNSRLFTWQALDAGPCGAPHAK